MDGIHHLLRLREAGAVEFVAAPRILLPVEPVDYYVVNRNPALAVLVQHAQDLFLGVVFLAALPVAHRPFRHDRGLAGEFAVASRNPVAVFCCDEVVINLLLHLTPPAHRCLFFLSFRKMHLQGAVGYASVRHPVDLDWHFLAPFKLHAELVGVRVPRCPPTLRNHFLAVDFHALVACIIEAELIDSALLRVDVALVAHLGSEHREVLRQAVDVVEVSGDEVVEVKVLLLPYQSFMARCLVGSGDFGIKDGKVLPVARIAEAAETVAVPEHAVASRRYCKRNADLGVVLEQFLALPLVVEFFALVLSQAVDALAVIRTAEGLGDGVAVASVHCDILETPVFFAEYQLSVGSVEGYFAVIEAYLHLQGCGADAKLPVFVLHAEILELGLLKDHQGFIVGEPGLGCGADSYDSF